MMQRSRRLAASAAAIGLLVLGGITAGVEAAQANVAGFCHGSGKAATCPLNETIAAPASVTVGVTATVNGDATVTWSATCTLNGTTATTSGATTSMTPTQDALLPLPATAGGQCTVKAGVSLPTTDAANTLTAAMTYTPAASASPSPTSSAPAPSSGHVVRGYAGKCVDDAGNSSADRAKVQIWDCNTFDKAQLWTYSNGELVHNGKCLNDRAWGGNRTKVILYTCNRALNELWTHQSNGQYVLNAKGYKLCLDDPANSTRNGTQLIVYTCKDSVNQRWTKP
jgi:Ricin-type beta-trefoil lectin domain